MKLKVQCAREGITLAIRGTVETFEEESLEIDFMQVTNDIESTFCQSGTKYRTKIDRLLTEKDGLIKAQNILREETDQLISHTETFAANFQNLLNYINPIKTKAKS